MFSVQSMHACMVQNCRLAVYSSHSESMVINILYLPVVVERLKEAVGMVQEAVARARARGAVARALEGVVRPLEVEGS